VFLIKEKAHPLFKRDGVHLFMEKDVPVVNALTGFEFVVPHVDGKRKLLVSSPEGSVIKPGDAKEITGEGMPVPTRPYEHGNLYIKFNVVFPDKLNKTQTAALQKSLPGAETPNKQGMEFEEVQLRPINPDNMRQEAYSTHGNAYDEDEDDDGRHGQSVQCAQQ